MANRLAHETSPYLRQHADNPVDWYPWGPDALERARREDRPILLSIGYAACHWCHVMAHESFEDEATAAIMNERFVNVKVDREERPDLDSMYMQAVQAMTGHGGWPMTVFLTPEGVPYYGGTYYPNEERHGMPSFARVLNAVSDAYANRKEQIAQTTASVRQMYDSLGLRPTPGAEAALAPALFDRAFTSLRTEFDERHGGFGGAPKFPPTMVLEWLLTRWARRGDGEALRMARATFVRMGRGGIYDHVGGGFARYSVDATWLVPHFEKMLYDNALLIRFGAHLWQATKDEEVRRVTLETIAWVRREMTAPDGGFYSSLDADSEGHEGKFYVWSVEELRDVLGDDAPALIDYWGASAEGNFEGTNILFAQGDRSAIEATIERGRQALYERRAARVWPGRDDKVVASWNGLMIRALAEAGRAFGDDEVLELARRAAEHAFSVLVRDGRAMRSTLGGVTKIAGFLEDHAALGLAALAMYDASFDPRWIERARSMSDAIARFFWDPAAESLYDSASDHEALITRPRDIADNAIPSGTSLAAELFLRIAELTGDDESRRLARRIAESLAESAGRYPLAFGNLLCVADMLVHGTVEIALVGAESEIDALRAVIDGEYVPARVLAGASAPVPGMPLLDGRAPIGGKGTAYVCRGFTCDAPTVSPEELGRQLIQARGAGRAV